MGLSKQYFSYSQGYSLTLGIHKGDMTRGFEQFLFLIPSICEIPTFNLAMCHIPFNDIQIPILTPKVMLPVLLCLPTTLESDGDGMALEVEPSCQ